MNKLPQLFLYDIKYIYHTILQEPESSACLFSDTSNEENSRTMKFLDLSFSFGSPLTPTIDGDQERMRFSSPNTADNIHVIDSNSVESHGSNYINLDLTI